MSKSKIHGIMICLIINLIIFPIELYEVRTYQTNPQNVTEVLLFVLRPILFGMGGILLHHRMYAQGRNTSVNFLETLKRFLKTYGGISLCSLLLWFFFVYDDKAVDYVIMEEVFRKSAEGQVSYDKFPVWKIFVIENMSVSAIFSYLFFTISYFWQKSKNHTG